jgi:hypothetical protein
MACAQPEKKEEKKAPLPVAFQASMAAGDMPTKLAFFDEIKCKTVPLEFSCAADYVQTVDIRGCVPRPCTGLCLILSHSKIDAAILHPEPIRSAALMVNGIELLRYDTCDLHEWNWLKVNRGVPADRSYCLFPFSRQFGTKEANALNLKCAHSVTLVLRLNGAMEPLSWTMQIVAFTRNVLEYADYACRLLPSIN